MDMETIGSPAGTPPVEHGAQLDTAPDEEQDAAQEHKTVAADPAADPAAGVHIPS